MPEMHGRHAPIGQTGLDERETTLALAAAATVSPATSTAATTNAAPPSQPQAQPTGAPRRGRVAWLPRWLVGAAAR